MHVSSFIDIIWFKNTYLFGNGLFESFFRLFWPIKFVIVLKCTYDFLVLLVAHADELKSQEEDFYVKYLKYFRQFKTNWNDKFYCEKQR